MARSSLRGEGLIRGNLPLNVHVEDPRTMIINEYETTLIFHPDAPESEVKRINERLDGVIESFDGTKLFHDVWGVRKLAYNIQKQAHGNYHHLGFTAKADCIAEFERVIRIESHLIRFLTVRLLENVDVEERKLVASKRVAVMANEVAEEPQGKPGAPRPRPEADKPEVAKPTPEATEPTPEPTKD